MAAVVTNLRLVNSPFPSPVLRVLITACLDEDSLCHLRDAIGLEVPLSVEQVPNEPKASTHGSLTHAQHAHAHVLAVVVPPSMPRGRHNVSYRVLSMPRNETRRMHVRVEYSSREEALQLKPPRTAFIGLKTSWIDHNGSPKDGAIRLKPSTELTSSACERHLWRLPGRWLANKEEVVPFCGKNRKPSSSRLRLNRLKI